VAKGFKIGEGFIEVGADSDGIARDVDRSMRDLPGRVGGSTQRAGRGIGSGIGRAIAAGVTAPLAAASRGTDVLADGIMKFTKLLRGPALAAIPIGIALLPAAMRVATAALAVGGAAIVGAGIAAITAKIAFNGMGDALKALKSGDAEAISEAMARLSPHARTAALAIDGVRVSSRGLREIVQERFFAPFAHDIAGLAKDYLPLLEGGLGRVSSAMGRGVAGLIAWARESGTMRTFRGLVDNVAAAMERTNFRGYLNGFLIFIAGGSKGLGGLADKVTEWGKTFEKWATRITSDGSLKRWVGDGKKALEGLGDALKTVRDILDGIQKVMDAGKKVSNFLDGMAEGANRNGRETRGHIKGFLDWFKPTFPAEVKRGTDAGAAEFGTVPPRAGAGMAGLGATIMGVTGGAMGGMTRTFSTGVGNSLLHTAGLPLRAGLALAGLGGFITPRAQGAWSSFANATSAGSGRATGIARSHPGQANRALGPLGGMISFLAGQAWVRFNASTSAGTARANAIARAHPGQAQGAVSPLSGMISGVASRAWGGFTNATRGGANRAQEIVRGIPGQAQRALSGLSGTLKGAGSSLLGGFISGMRSRIPDVGAAARAAMSVARQFFPFSPAKAGPFAGRGHTSYSGRALVSDFAGGIRAEQGQAVAAVRSVLGAAKASIGGGVPVPSAGHTAGAERPSAGFGGGDVTVHVTQTSGSPAETGRMVALALRTVG